MTTAPDLTTSTPIAATDQTKAAAAPRIKLQSHGFSIDHPDPEIGEQLMADTLGVADREAMHGIIRQLVKASVSGESPDEVNLAFMQGGAAGSAAPRANRNARKHGRFTRDALAERRQIQVLLGEARKLLEEMK
jgi:hypothetical protein